MLVECEEDPNKIIRDIGDRYFSICDDENMHPDHPETVRIADCEYDCFIEVYDEWNPGRAMIMAQRLVKLLNQEYKEFYPEIYQ